MVGKFKKKLTDIALALIAYGVICLSYVDVVVPIYNFGGFVMSDASAHELPIMLVIIYVLMIPKIQKEFIGVYLVLSFYFLFLPAAILCAVGGKSLETLFYIFFGTFSVNVFYKILGGGGVSAGIKIIKLKIRPLIISMMILVLITAYISKFKFNLNFSDVYDYRFDFNDRVVFALNYILPFMGGPLLSFLVVVSAHKKDNWELVFLLAIAILLYGFSSHKTFLFGPIFSFFFYKIIEGKHSLYRVLGAFFVIISIFSVLAVEQVGGILGAMFTNRVVFLPAGISFEFFDHFGRIGYIYWAESKLSLGFVKSPLSMESVNYIAEAMMGDNKVSANVGWIPNGFMNFGAGGILFYSFILAYVIYIFDRWVRFFGAGVLVAAVGKPLLSVITSIDLMAWLLTGGVIPFMLIIYGYVMILRRNDRSIIKIMQHKNNNLNNE